MNMIAHRGYWKSQNERNTLPAFERALNHGYGIETDIRDHKGELVISHNMASGSCIRLKEFLEVYKSIGCESVLALNIKADGICEILYKTLREYGVNSYFTFDMSVPEMVLYKKMGCRYFSRQSDIERDCVLYQNAAGVWLDAFYDYSWLNPEIVKKHISEGKDVVIVSPELHGMDNDFLWDDLNRSGLLYYERLFLCTDKPDAAERYLGVPGL